MTSMLRASTLATVVGTFLSVGSPQGSFTDARGDWSGYAWQQIKVSQCLPAGDVLQCPPYHQKWDWKRDQWVDISIELDIERGELRLTQRLTDNDPTDFDWVCVTALAVDAEGNNLVAHHQNWEVYAGQVLEDDFRYPSRQLNDVAAIHIGSKQCRDGAGQDNDLYARVLAGIEP